MKPGWPCWKREGRRSKRKFHQIRQIVRLRLKNEQLPPIYDPASEDEYWDVPKADGRQLELFYEHLEQVLVDMDFHDPDNPRLLMPRMRRLFGRIRPDSMEINILRGVLTYVDDHVKRASANTKTETYDSADKPSDE